MLTLLSECHFWTLQNELRIKLSDFGAYKYSTKKNLNHEDLASQSKNDYAERRDIKTIISNRKTAKLKTKLKELEELMKIYKVIISEWKDHAVIQLLLSNGIIVHICVNIFTGDVIKMAFDKYFVGKIVSENIVNALFSRQHIILSYNINQITIVYLQKPNTRRSGPEKISNMDPKIFNVIIPGPSDRKLARKLSMNKSFDSIIIWTKSSLNEVYPWRPTIRDQDRANVHVFKLRSIKLESISYCWTENDPICVEFIHNRDECLLTIEQKISRKGEVTAEICLYNINQLKLQRISVTTISIGTQICSYSFSPDQEKIAIGTIDRHICIHDLVKKVTKFAPQTDIIPTQCTWHQDSSLIIIGNERSQFQCFDISLTPIATQLISEDVTPSNLLDLSHYFTVQHTLFNISFSAKANINFFNEKYAQTDCFLLLLFENGPIGCLRFFAGTGLNGDVHNSGLTPDVLINKYLLINQFDKATSILLTMNWETYGSMCLLSLQNIVSFIFTRTDLKTNRTELLCKILQTFNKQLNNETKEEFGDQVMDLKRKFFFFLLRNKQFMKAFEIALDIGDYDLFMDLFNITKLDSKLYDFSRESFQQANIILNQSESITNDKNIESETNSNSSCSNSSCSECSIKDNTIKKQQKLKTKSYTKLKNNRKIIAEQNNIQNINGKLRNYVPPLPHFKSSILNAEQIKIHIPKPEIKLKKDNDTKFRNINKAGLKNLFDNSNRSNINDFNHYSNHNLSNNHNKLLLNSNERNNQLKNINNMQSTSSAIQKTISKNAWPNIPDQTLGIPNLNLHVKNLSMPVSISTSSSSIPRPYTFMPLSHISSNQSKSIDIIDSKLPKFYQHPLVLGKIPSNNFNLNGLNMISQKKPFNSILLHNANAINNTGTNMDINRKDTGEKNKVKFSDTVQVAVVPEIPRKEKPLLPKRNGFHSILMDPQKELADSLPLCHPHDEYLKDFNPVTENNKNFQEQLSENVQNKCSPSIKVVHFGVV